MYFTPRIILRVLHHVDLPELLGGERGLEVAAVFGAVVQQFDDLIFAESLLQFLLVKFSALPDENRYKVVLLILGPCH